MRQIDEATLWKIRAFLSNRESLNKDIHILKQQIENIHLQIQNVDGQMKLAQANVENLLMYEKKRLNIPDPWIFDVDEGIFKDPATMNAEEKKRLGLGG